MSSLLATMCECNQIFIPPRNNCIKCLKPTRITEIDNCGKLLTYTVLNTVPEGFNAPLILGIVELENRNIANNSNHPNPKLICQGRIEKSRLEIGLRIKIIKENELYYFIE